MKTIEIIILIAIFAASLLYATRTVVGPFVFKGKSEKCKGCSMAGKCKKK